ncbi:MAG TPA: hypothetical protein VFM76_02310 [Methylophaga sp.]|nr:hypothetical protein [Methylophaga sp.]
MINEKIAAAKQAKRLHIFQALLFVLLLSLLGLGVLYWASQPKTPDLSLEETEPESAPAATIETAPPADNAELRQAYLEAYARFENELRPQLNKIDLPAWDKALSEKLVNIEKQAVQQFAASNYVKAYNAITQLIKLTEDTITDSQSQFTEAMQTAQSAFDNNNYPNAKQVIDKALMLDTSSEAAKKLAERVAQLPEINDLLKQIKTANAENNRQRERDLINQLLKLVPEREALKQRGQQLTTAINNDNFQQQINQAYQALENANLAAAQSALDKARQLYPDRSEVRALNQAIQQAKQNQQLRQLQSKVASAESADNWIAVQTHRQEIQSLRPADKANAEQLAVANKIVSLQQQIDAALASPYRLSNQSVAEDAKALLAQASNYQNQSATLAAKRQRFAEVLAAANQPVAVNINSDNQTFISVRGVGNVGVIDAKTIQLKPGNYTFEGKRTGYKSKLIEVEVPLDQAAISVTLICDEAI